MLAAKNHPDRHGEDAKAAAEEEFRSIQDAYDKLKGRFASVTEGAYVSLGGSKRDGLSSAFNVRPSKETESKDFGLVAAVRPLELEVVEVFLANAKRKT